MMSFACFSAPITSVHSSFLLTPILFTSNTEISYQPWAAFIQNPSGSELRMALRWHWTIVIHSIRFHNTAYHSWPSIIWPVWPNPVITNILLRPSQCIMWPSTPSSTFHCCSGDWMCAVESDQCYSCSILVHHSSFALWSISLTYRSISSLSAIRINMS